MSKNLLKLHKLELDDELVDDVNFDELDDEIDELDDEIEKFDHEEEVEEAIKEVEEVVVLKNLRPERVKVSYTVRVIAKMLKYFAGPSIDYPILGVIKNNEKLKIIEETGSKKSLWGRIDSKEKAWVPLAYCERID